MRALCFLVMWLVRAIFVVCFFVVLVGILARACRMWTHFFLVFVLPSLLRRSFFSHLIVVLLVANTSRLSPISLSHTWVALFVILVTIL